ncbi:MAG: hypothetical protein K6F18_02000 [Lactobacillus sp.]|nr:hypothetical protein [Lactobacillus sp.]
MTDYYVIDDKIYGHYPKAYKYSELIKALNNANTRQLLDFDITLFDVLVLYQDVKSIKRLPNGYFKIVYGSCQTIHGKKLTRLLHSANAWYQTAKANENWDGQMNYLVQSNLLGNPVFVPFLTTPSHHSRSKHLIMRHTPHSTAGLKSGRVGHTMGANARYTYRKRDMVCKLKEYPVTHHNRKDRRHQFRFPVFDDDEYCLAKHSTGWKYSTKCKHQYEIHQ